MKDRVVELAYPPEATREELYDIIKKAVYSALKQQRQAIVAMLRKIESFTIDDWYALDYEDESSIEAIDKKDLDQAIQKIKEME